MLSTIAIIIKYIFVIDNELYIIDLLKDIISSHYIFGGYKDEKFFF
jgi:hypothetical protein